MQSIWLRQISIPPKAWRDDDRLTLTPHSADHGNIPLTTYSEHSLSPLVVYPKKSGLNIAGLNNSNSLLRWRDHMGYESINFKRKLELFDEQWMPKVVAEMNDYQFKVVKLQGDFVWHDHKDTDETFIVIDGNLRIDFRDGVVNVAAGEMYVVPKGVEHKPYAEDEVKLLLIEPRGVLNTGHEGGDRTAENDVWI